MIPPRRFGDGCNAGWTEDRIATLIRLHADGLSCAKIAGALGGGVTRNAVIGKIGRLRAAGKLAASASKTPAPPREAFKRDAPAKVAPVPEPPSAPAAAPAINVPAEPISVFPVTIMDSRSEHCRWPLWSDADEDRFYCGDPVVPGKSYCRGHFAIHCGSGTWRERAATQVKEVTA